MSCAQQRAAERRVRGASSLHAAYERALADALRADDPVAFLRAAADQPDCGPALRRILLTVCSQPNGLRITALLCTRLRFERLLQGSAHASTLFSADPARFATLFRAYHRAVTPTARGPRSEAALFARWLREAE